MPIDIEPLAQLLSASDSPTLSTQQAALLRAALAQLATSQALIARQQALLESFASDTADIETAIANSLDATRAALVSPSPLSNYNAPAARAARTTLLKQLDSASSLDAWLVIILRFVSAISLPLAP